MLTLRCGLALSRAARLPCIGTVLIVVVRLALGILLPLGLAAVEWRARPRDIVQARRPLALPGELRRVPWRVRGGGDERTV